jgi:uncharacterized protein with HEPN domain
MSPAKKPEVRLRHILREIDGVAATIAGKAFADFSGNYVLERVVERAIEIISEAAKALPPDLRETYPGVQWQPIIAIGNRLRHEYYRLSHERLWEIATIYLPDLRPVVLAMLEDRGEAG